MIKELGKENLIEEIKQGLTLVDFYAVWCGPCKMMHPIIEEIHTSYPDLKIIKVNVDEHEELARNYGIMSIPTLILFQNGNIVEKNIGLTPKEQLEKWLNQHQ